MVNNLFKTTHTITKPYKCITNGDPYITSKFYNYKPIIINKKIEYKKIEYITSAFRTCRL